MTDQLEQPTRGRGRRSNRARRLGLMRRSGLLLVLLAIGALLASVCSRTSGPGDESVGAQAASCGSASFCMALLGNKSGPGSFDLFMTTSENGGISWSRATPMPLLGWDGGSSVQLVCVTSRECLAGDLSDFGVITFDRGKTWRTMDAPVMGGTVGLACLNQTCFEANSRSEEVIVFRSRNGGRTWQRMSSLASPGALTGGPIACSSVDTCLILTTDKRDSEQIQSTTDGGEYWKPVDFHLAPNQELDGWFTCLSMGSCLVATATQTQQGDNPPVLVAGVDVISPSGLLLANHVVFRSETLDGLSGLSCVSADVCFAAPTGAAGTGNKTTYIHRSVDGGQTWPSVVVQGIADPDYESVACGTGSQNCVMTNGSYSGSPLLSSTDGGQSWTHSVVPDWTLRYPSYSHPNS